MKLTKRNINLILALLLIAIVLPSGLAEKILSGRLTRHSRPRREKEDDWLESSRKGSRNGPSVGLRPAPIPRKTGGFNFENTIRYITSNSRIFSRNFVFFL